jgi:hypothetical protein
MIVCSEDVPYDVAARLAYEIDSGADRWGRCLLSLPRWLQRLVPAPRAFALFSLVCVLATFHIMHDIAVRFRAAFTTLSLFVGYLSQTSEILTSSISP